LFRCGLIITMYRRTKIAAMISRGSRLVVDVFVVAARNMFPITGLPSVDFCRAGPDRTRLWVSQAGTAARRCH
jgi:hypothetical protein